MPSAKKLIAKPTITWSTRYLIENTASIHANTTPVSIAIMVPNQRFVSDAPTAPVNAPASNMPSIAILITPLRSHKMPARAPSVIGTLRETVSCNMPTRLNDSPEVAQDKKLITNIAVASAKTMFETLPNPRHNCAAPRPTKTMPKM